MSFSLIPDYSFQNLTDITPDFLKKSGVKLLLLDLDNTISPYGEKEPSEPIRRWMEDIKKANITPFIVSNTRKPRAGTFADKLGIPYVMRAKKPSRFGLREAMRVIGCTEKETALVGDQIFTDTLAANRANVISIIVEPIAFPNIFLAARYYLEKPFRIMTRISFRRKHNE